LYEEKEKHNKESKLGELFNSMDNFEIPLDVGKENAIILE